MAKIFTPPSCPQCRAPLPNDRLNGLCPACFFSSANDLFEPQEKSRLHVPGLADEKELARGGMGIIYSAEQADPRRRVALKVLQPQWAENEGVRERFRREAHAMAGLEHPAILPVYGVGETDGLPWFTMKLATGGSLAQRIRDYSGRWSGSAELIARLARALSFAHERGVLHRDVKPGNILFDSDHRPYLADFGLAKYQAATGTALTLHAEVLGTPHYLAPELASGQSRTATTASDIYSLGAVLYELLTGQPPYRDENLPALLRRIADEPPASIDSFLPRPPRDLRAIGEKAMAREPEHRYATARDLAEDLERFLRGDAVQARQAGAGELFWRWCRRHPAVASLLAMVAVLLTAIAIGSTMAAIHIGRAEKDAVSARDRSEENLRKSMLAEAEGIRLARLLRFREHALQLVASAAHPQESAAWRMERRSEAIAALAYPELKQHGMPPAPAPGWKPVAMSPGLEFTAWRAPHGQGWQVTRGPKSEPVCRTEMPGYPVRISADGLWLAAVAPKNGWQLWSLAGAQAQLKGEFRGYPEDFSHDGSAVAYFWLAAGKITGLVQKTANAQELMRVEFPDVALKMRFSPDGALCAIAPSSYANVGSLPYTVRLHRVAGGEMVRELSAGLANCIWCMAWSADGRMFGASERGGATFVWDAVTGNPRHVFRGTGTSLWQMAFSPDGRRLATIGDDQLLTIFDLVGGQPLARGGAWTADGVPTMSWSTTESGVFGPVAVDGINTFIRVEPASFSAYRMEDSHGRTMGLCPLPGRPDLIVGDSRHARRCDPEAGVARQTFGTGLWSAFTVSSDGAWLYGLGEPGLHRWRITPEGIDEGSRATLGGGNYGAISLDRAGRHLAACFNSSRVWLYEDPAAAQPKVRHFSLSGARSVSLSADGTRLAAGGYHGVAVWDVASGQRLFFEPEPASWVEFDPRGTALVVARTQYEVLATTTWKVTHTLPSRPLLAEGPCAAFTPDGRWLATTHAFGRIALWATTDWTMLATIESPSRSPLGRLAFNREATRLHSGTTSGVVHTWDLERLAGELKGRGLEWSGEVPLELRKGM